MSPHRFVQATSVTPDTLPVISALTVGAVAADLVAPVNIILGIAFFAGALLDLFTGVLRAFVQARETGQRDGWFNEQTFAIGTAKKLALVLFIPIASIVDVVLQVAPVTATLGDLSPTTKAALVALAFGQASSAARNIYAIAGPQAAGVLSVILRRTGEGD